MLIDSLTFTLEKSGCLDAFWGKLDEGLDGTLGVASSARPFLVAARFAHRPQTTLVVVAGEEAAIAFARQVAAYLGDERVMRFPERSDYPFVPKPSDPAQVARRMEAVHALSSRKPRQRKASGNATQVTKPRGNREEEPRPRTSQLPVTSAAVQQSAAVSASPAQDDSATQVVSPQPIVAPQQTSEPVSNTRNIPVSPQQATPSAGEETEAMAPLNPSVPPLPQQPHTPTNHQATTSEGGAEHE